MENFSIEILSIYEFYIYISIYALILGMSIYSWTGPPEAS